MHVMRIRRELRNKCLCVYLYINGYVLLFCAYLPIVYAFFSLSGVCPRDAYEIRSKSALMRWQLPQNNIIDCGKITKTMCLELISSIRKCSHFLWRLFFKVLAFEFQQKDVKQNEGDKGVSILRRLNKTNATWALELCQPYSNPRLHSSKTKAGKKRTSNNTKSNKRWIQKWHILWPDISRFFATIRFRNTRNAKWKF